MTTPIRLAGAKIRGAITRSPDTGYFSIAYGNGRFVAVGHQLGAASGSDAGDGPAVTAPGASVSSDGGYTWRDVKLPFFGQKQIYDRIAYRSGFWACSSKWLRSGVNQHYKLLAQDTPNLDFWNPLFVKPSLGTTVNAWAILGLDASPDGWMYAGIAPGPSAGSSYTTNCTTFDARTDASYPAITSTVWTGRRFLLFSQWNTVATQPGNIAAAYTLPRAVPWGTNTASAGWVYDSASDGTNVLCSTTDQRTAVGQAVPPGKQMWLTKDDGVSWLNYGKLPGVESIESICYTPKLDLWCALGFDRRDFSSVCFIGKPGMEGGDFSASGGVNKWMERKLPTAVWKAVASDGESFVAVSQDGYRMVIDLSQQELNALGVNKKA